MNTFTCPFCPEQHLYPRSPVEPGDEDEGVAHESEEDPAYGYECEDCEGEAYADPFEPEYDLNPFCQEEDE